MRRAYVRCKCGGVLKVRKCIEIREGESYTDLYLRLKDDDFDVFRIHKCDDCNKLKLYQQK